MKDRLFAAPILDPIPSAGLLVARLAFGGFMLAGHGWGKLMSFGELSATFPDLLGIGSAGSLAAAVFAEVLCAGLILVGLATRPACIPLLITMAVAAFVVHWGDPLFMGQGAAKEPALLYLAGTAVLLATGPGRYSLDALIGSRSAD